MLNQSIQEMFDLSGQVAIVTGSGMGIGRGIAIRLAEAGAKIMVVDIDDDSAHTTVNEINANGGEARAIHADVGLLPDIYNAVQGTVEAFGRVNILVNNAGYCPYTPVMSITEALWDRVHGTNLKGLFFFAQAVAKEMIKAGDGGRIVNIASIDSLHPMGDLTAYDASKGGVLMATKSMARELGVHRILVNAIAPGGIDTPMARSFFSSYKNPEKAMRELGERTPLKRWGQPDDIARAVLFLASPAGDYITGSLLVVDGGLLLM